MSKNHIVKLKDVISTKIQNGYSPLCQEYSSGVWVLSLGALTGYSFDSSQIKAVSSTVKMPEEYRLKDNDILVSRSNTLDKVGRCGVFHGEIENCFYPDLMMRFRADEEFVLTKYLEIVLQSEVARKYFQERAAGTSVSMMKINKKILEDFSFSLPSLKEQGKIIEITQVWDSAIEKTEKLISEKEKLYKWYLNYFYIENENCIKLREFTKETSRRNKSKEVTQVLSVTNKNGFVLPEQQFGKKIASEDLSNYKIVEKGQFAYNPSRINVGSIARLDDFDSAVLSPMYTVFEINTNLINSDYFLHWLSSKYAIHQIKLCAQGGVREIVGFEDFEKMRIKLLSYEKQEKIADFLNLQKSEISLLKKQLEQYRLQKQVLMQKLLTGEWRVK